MASSNFAQVFGAAGHLMPIKLTSLLPVFSSGMILNSSWPTELARDLPTSNQCSIEAPLRNLIVCYLPSYACRGLGFDEPL